MRRRILEGAYRPHARSGMAYMLAPVLRAYPNPYHSDRRVTRSVPHRMFYAPFVDNDDIGGDPRTNDPFVIHPGPHGYIVVRAGDEERAAIVREHADLIRDLCRIQPIYCLDETPGALP